MSDPLDKLNEIVRDAERANRRRARIGWAVVAGIMLLVTGFIFVALARMQ